MWTNLQDIWKKMSFLITNTNQVPSWYFENWIFLFQNRRRTRVSLYFEFWRGKLPRCSCKIVYYVVQKWYIYLNLHNRKKNKKQLHVFLQKVAKVVCVFLFHLGALVHSRRLLLWRKQNIQIVNLIPFRIKNIYIFSGFISVPLCWVHVFVHHFFGFLF